MNGFPSFLKRIKIKWVFEYLFRSQIQHNNGETTTQNAGTTTPNANPTQSSPSDT